MVPHQLSDKRLRHEQAFTLLEVVIALVLLATLLVSTLLATTAQQRNIQLAEDRHRATQLADELLASWLNSQEGIPLQGRGRFPGHPDLSWQTRVASATDFLGTIVPIVRIEIQRSPGRRPTQRSATLLSLEVLVDRRAQ